MRLIALLLFLLACGGEPAKARTGEELLSAWLPVKLGEPAGERPGFEKVSDTQWLETTADRVTELNLVDARVHEVAIEWKGDAANAAEQALRGRLPPPHECAGAHREIAEFKPLLWQLADGSSVAAIRKGKTYRVTVARPASDAFKESYAACVVP